MNGNTTILVVGNEKGGAGKTTFSVHLIVSLLKLGFSVGSIDLDGRQQSLSRYLSNRRKNIFEQKLLNPVHTVVRKSPFNVLEEAEEDEDMRFTEALSFVSKGNDFVVVDTPGSDTFLSRLAHSYADTVITPINDSFVDLDVLAHVKKDSLEIDRPGIYSEMVWEQKVRRAKRDGGEIDWVVLRNRLSSLDAKNKRNMANVLDALSKRLGCRVAAGFSERVVFRELFLNGLTLLDIVDRKQSSRLSISHIAARQELQELLANLRIPKLQARLQEKRVPSEVKAAIVA